MEMKLKHRLLSMVLSLLMVLSLIPATVFAADDGGAGITVNGVTYQNFADAVAAATPAEDGTITYSITGKVEVTDTGWIQVVKNGLGGVTKVKFVGNDASEISITGGLAVLADQTHDVDVEFENLTLSKPNAAYGGDYGHSTNYFTTWLRNTNAADNTVTYTNCVFPNGASNNQYGKTVFNSCQFTNSTTGLYNLWVYGGNVEVNGSSFTGVRGVKVYTEGAPETAPALTVKGSSFSGLTEKAAVVVSKAADITFDNVDVTRCSKGFFQKAIEGSSTAEEVTISANGEGIGGTFNVTADKSVDAAKNEFNITAGKFTGDVNEDYLAEGFALAEDGTVTALSNAVAKIGETEYETLAEAVSAAEDGATVTLLADATADVTIGKNITLDLGRKTLTGTGASGKATLTIAKGATANVKNGTVLGTNNSYYTIQNNGTATFDDVTATAGNTGSSMIDNFGTLTINSGTYTGGLNTVKNEPNAKLTITNGAFELTKSNSGFTAVVLNYGELNISGGEFVQSDKTSSRRNSQVIHTDKDGSAAPSTVITGGTFTNLGGTTAWTVRVTNAAAGSTKVSGGTFNKKVSDSYCADGFIPTKNADGTYGVKEGKYVAKIDSTGYETLEAAINAAKAGKTITLLDNVTVDALSLSKGVTIKSVEGELYEIKGLKSIGGTGVTLENVYLNLTSTLEIGGTNTKLTNCTIRAKDLDWDWGNENPFDSDTYNTDPYNYLTKVTGTNVTLTNCTIDGRPSDGSYFSDMCLAKVTGETVTMKDCTFYEGTYACANSAPKGTWTLDGCKFSRIYHDPIEVVNSENDPTIVVNDCDLVGCSDFNDPEATVIFTNCRFGKAEDHDAAYYGVYSYAKNTSFTNCSFTEDYMRNEDDKFFNGIYFGNNVTVEMNDCTLAGTKDGLADLFRKEEVNDTGLAAIDAAKDENGKYTGGTFVGDESAITARVADGHIPVENADGTYNVKVGTYVAEVNGKKYETLADAIAAADDGAAITLLANIDVTETLKITKSVIIDLNGKTVTNVSGNNTFDVTGTLKITGDGIINLNANGIRVTGGALEIAGGTFNYNRLGGAAIIMYGNAKFEMTGGKLEVAAGSAVNSGYYGTQNIDISGGTIVCSHGSNHVFFASPFLGTPDVTLTVSGNATIKVGNPDKFVGDEYTKVAVSGGNFDAKIDDKYLAKGFELKDNGDGTYGVQAAAKGSAKNPYTLAELGAMTRDEYIAAQEALSGTMYVEVGDYSYDKNGVLGNGKRDDTTGQVEDRSVLNGYNSNGYLGEKNDGANGKNIIFVGGSITSDATGYASIDNIGTSLLLAVPAYTNVTFEGVTFNNVMSFDYQLYTGPWSQLGELKFNNCKFNGLIVGAIAAQTLTFDGCEFTNYTNTAGANNSNPTWIRPAYGNWTKGDNEGQGDDFRSLTTINFNNNTVTSTRPVKFERIAQWEMDTTVSINSNKVTISAQEGDTSTKNVGFYFGANAKFDLILDGNEKLGDTAALYTAVYNAPNGKSYAGLPAGSTVKDSKGAAVEATDALAWKTTDSITLKTTTEAVEVGGVKFATLEEAYAAAANGATITLLEDCESGRINLEDKSVTVVLNGKTLTSTAAYGVMFCAKNGNTITIDGTAEGSKLVGTLMITSGTDGHIVINGGTYENSQYCPIYVNGAVNSDNSTVAVNDATIKATGTNSDQDKGVAVYLAGYSTSTFTNSTIEAPVTGIEIRAGELTIDNCTVTGGSGEIKENANGNGSTVANVAIAVSQHATKKAIEVNIKSGTFNGTAAVYQTDIQGTGSENVKTNITGGTFNGTIKAATNGAIAISGGTFSSEVNSDYCADGFKPVKNADGTYTVAEIVLTVVLKSGTENAGTLTGGGEYTAEEVEAGITITATPVGGYTFIGWYDSNDDLLTNDTEYTIPTNTRGEVTYTAKFVGNVNQKLTVNVGNGSVTAEYGSITRKWNVTQTNIPFTKGTYFTLTAKANGGFEFLYWVDKDFRIVSFDSSYSFYLGDDKTLTAVYRETESEDPYVIIRDMNDKIISSGYAYDGVFSVPEHSEFEGYKFIGWKYDDDSVCTIDNGQFTGITKSVTIFAKYEYIGGTFAVTVNNGQSDSATYAYASIAKVTANEPDEGKFFAGWYNGKILVSTEMVYSFIVTGDVTLTAKYSDEPIASAPTVNMSMGARTVDASTKNNKVVMNVAWNVPSGYTFIEGGLIRTLDNTKENSLTLGNVDNNTIKKNMTKLSSASGTYSYTLTMGSVSSAKTLYAVGYIIYRNNATGAIETIYTGMNTSIPLS